jgi:hypothetical protein
MSKKYIKYKEFDIELNSNRGKINTPYGSIIVQGINEEECINKIKEQIDVLIK